MKEGRMATAKIVQVLFRITASQYEDLQRIATAQGCSVNECSRLMVQKQIPREMKELFGEVRSQLASIPEAMMASKITDDSFASRSRSGMAEEYD